MQHTEGRWIRSGHVIHTHDGTLIADLRRKPPSSVFECHIGNMHLTLEEITANACLIEAAVDMFEALKALYEHTRNNYQICGLNEAARTAIAKARGEWFNTDKDPTR